MIKTSENLTVSEVSRERSPDVQFNKRLYNPSSLSVIEMGEIETGGTHNIQEVSAGSGFFGS